MVLVPVANIGNEIKANNNFHLAVLPHLPFTTPLTEVLCKHLSCPSKTRHHCSCLPLRQVVLSCDEEPTSPGSPITEALCSIGYPRIGKSEGLAFHLPSRQLARLLRRWVGKLAWNQARFWLKPAWQASLEMCLCFVRRFVKTDTFSQNVLILINRYFTVGIMFPWNFSDQLRWL